MTSTAMYLSPALLVLAASCNSAIDGASSGSLALVADAPGTAPMTAPNAPPLPPLAIGVEPQDLATNVGAMVPRVAISGGTPLQRQAIATSIASSVKLTLWPEAVAVPADVVIPPPDTKTDFVRTFVEVHATDKVLGRWYSLSFAKVKDVSPMAGGPTTSFSDGTVGVRFRTDSETVLREVDWCEKTAGEGDLSFVFSEPIRVPDGAGPSSLPSYADDAGSVCKAVDASGTVSALHLRCRLDGSRLGTVNMPTGLLGLSGNVVIGLHTTLRFADRPLFAGCRVIRM